MKLISFDSEAKVLEVQMLGGRMTLTVDEALDYGRYPYHTALELRELLVGVGVDAPEVPDSLNVALAPKEARKALTEDEQKEAARNQEAYEKAMKARRATKKVKK